MQSLETTDREVSSGVERRPAREARNLRANLAMRLLGGFEIDLPGLNSADPIWRRAHARRLIQLLASSHGLCERRVVVLEALWPELDEVRARNRLHHTVHWLRRGFERVPEAQRPQINVTADKVHLSLPAGVEADVALFLDALAARSDDDSDRLATLDAAIAAFSGEFAPCWQDSHFADSRRERLGREYETALREAVDLAIDLDHTDEALGYARLLAHRLTNDAGVQCIYASLLADAGRSDIALQHCKAVRTTLAEADAAAAARIDELMRDIQKRCNREATVEPAAADLLGALSAGGQGPAPLRALRPLIGYGPTLDAAVKWASDPFARVLTLAGPPGSGKSLLAEHLCQRLQPKMRHGAVWVDCAGLADETGLLEVLAAALPVAAPAGPIDRAFLAHALSKLEMLIVLDALPTPLVARTAELLELLCTRGDARWVITAWRGLGSRFEKVLGIDPSQLLAAPAPGATPPAVQLLQADAGRQASADGGVTFAALQTIADSVGGLPLLLESAAGLLMSMSPCELRETLRHDRTTLLRPPPEGTSGPDAGPRLRRWLDEAPPSALGLLQGVARCRSWLTRHDIETITGLSGRELDAALNVCSLHHFLVRRVRHEPSGSLSEFKVPRYVLATLAIAECLPPAATVQQRMANWLMGGPGRFARLDGPGPDWLSWFDARVADISALVEAWHRMCDHDRIAAICLVHLPHARHSVHAPTLLSWMEALGVHAERASITLACRLLLARASLYADLGKDRLAYEDAQRALVRATDEGDFQVRTAALGLIRRCGTDSASALRLASAPQGGGVESAEALFISAQSAVRAGTLTEARTLSAQAAREFDRFGIRRGALKATLLEARVNFGLGHLDRCLESIDRAEGLAASVGDSHAAGFAVVMSARLAMARRQPLVAIEMLNRLLGQPGSQHDAMTVARALTQLAWGHYAMEALYPARALAREAEALLDQQPLSGHRAPELLLALIDARQDRHDDALSRTRLVIAGLKSFRYHTDLQGELIGVAELGVYLGQVELARAAMRALTRFVDSGGAHLRPWVADRLAGIRSQVPLPPSNRGTPMADLPALLGSLTL